MLLLVCNYCSIKMKSLYTPLGVKCVMMMIMTVVIIILQFSVPRCEMVECRIASCYG